MGHARIDHVGKRKVPALKGLVRQPGNEIDIDIFNSGGAGDVGAEAIDVAPENYAGEHVRGEVAVAAFAAAERDGDVEAERHWSYYPICRSAHLNWFEG